MLEKKITKSTDIRYVSIFYNQYKLTIPIKNGEIPYKQLYMPQSTPNIDIKAKIVDVMSCNGMSSEDIRLLMDGWPSKVLPSGRSVRRLVKPRSNNQSGYLGVSVAASTKSVFYTSTFRCDQVNSEKIFVRVKLKEGLNRNSYWLKRSEMQKAFINCCLHSDKLRGRDLKKRSYYLQFYKDVDWQPIINKERGIKIQSPGDSSIIVCIADNLKSAILTIKSFSLK